MINVKYIAKFFLIISLLLAGRAVGGQCLPSGIYYADENCEFVLPDYRDSIPVEDNCGVSFYSQTPAPGLITSPGETTHVVLTARDYNGNEATLSFDVTVLDTIPPTFICDAPPTGKRRIMVLADPNVDPTKETDDKMSLVRLMAYANEFDIEGIIATCSHNLYYRYTEPILDVISGYEEVLGNLEAHADGWPEPDYLRSVTKLGPASYGTMYALAEGTSDGGLLLAEALSEPLWVMVWGDGAVIAQALEYIRKTEGEGAAVIASRNLRVLDNAGQDDSGAWLMHHYPDIFYLRWIRGGMAMDPISDERLDWFPFCGECAQGESPYATDEWVKENIQVGPLGSLYPNRRYLKEGDSPTLLYMLSSEDPLQPHLGSWGGIFTEEPIEGVRSVRHPLGGNYEYTETEFDPYYMYALTEDTWNGYTSTWAGIFRHWKEFQLDFAERIQWSVNN